MNVQWLTDKLDRKVVYLPAVISPEMRFWRPDDLVYYPGLLRSAALGDSLGTKAKEHAYIFTDSGGFSLLTEAVNEEMITKEYVTDYANAYSDSVASLDYPPYVKDTFDVLTEGKEWERRLKFSAKNAIYMREHLEDHVKLFVVVHGARWDLAERWFAESDPTGEATSIALGPKPPSSYERVKMALCFAAEHGIKDIHLFAVYSYKVLLMMQYAQRHTCIDTITFDNTTWADGTRLYVMVNPLDIKREIQYPRWPQYRKAGCTCPVCQSYSWDEEKVPARIMDLHNLMMYQRQDIFIDALTDASIEEFLTMKIGEANFIDFAEAISDGFLNSKLSKQDLTRWAK